MKDTENAKKENKIKDFSNISPVEIDTDKVIGEICGAIRKAPNNKMVQDFFDSLLTQAELRDIAKRWLLVQEIEKGTPQRKIAKMFRMSLCKITRGSRELKKDNSTFLQMLNLSRAEEKK